MLQSFRDDRLRRWRVGVRRSLEWGIGISYAAKSIPGLGPGFRLRRRAKFAEYALVAWFLSFDLCKNAPTSNPPARTENTGSKPDHRADLAVSSMRARCWHLITQTAWLATRSYLMLQTPPPISMKPLRPV